MILFKCEIPGRVDIKKNNRRVFRAGKRMMSLPSIRHEAWVKASMPYVKQAWGGKTPIIENVEAHFKFYFKNHMGEPDTSNCVEAVADILQDGGVIANDKQIMRFTAEKIFGEAARTVVELCPYEGTSK